MNCQESFVDATGVFGFLSTPKNQNHSRPKVWKMHERFLVSKKGSVAGTAFVAFLFVILLGLAGYLLYLYLPTEPVDLKFINDNPANSGGLIEFTDSAQFYENLRYSDRRISYKIEDACDSKKRSEVETAFTLLQSKTVLGFYSVNIEPEITIFCSDIEPQPETEEYFVAGEGGPTEVINTSLYGVILKGEISFFREERCENPNIAIHELLHALGFDHNDNPDSILFPTLDCDQTIDESIINDINSLYAAPSLADLKVINIDATKSGRYLDFNIEIINQGLVNAGNVRLSVYADDKFIKEFDLESIDVGTKKSLEVTNLRISRGAETVLFVVDGDDLIGELSEDNNVVELGLTGV